MQSINKPYNGHSNNNDNKCNHPILARTQYKPSDCPIYQHERCLGQHFVMVEAMDNRGSKCHICGNSFCAHTDCVCRVPRDLR